MKVDSKILLVIVVVLFLLFGIVIYMVSRKKFISIPGNGSDIPANWDPTASTVLLHSALVGIGTDETAFFSTMTALTKGQLAMVYNKYLELYNTSIIADIQSDFTGNELTRALDYFKDIPGISLSKFARALVN